jgi:hypothetical protein
MRTQSTLAHQQTHHNQANPDRGTLRSARHQECPSAGQATSGSPSALSKVVSSDPQQALSRSRKRRNAGARGLAPRQMKASAALLARGGCRS